MLLIQGGETEEDRMYPGVGGPTFHTAEPSFASLNFPQAPSPGRPSSLGSPGWEGGRQAGQDPGFSPERLQLEPSSRCLRHVGSRTRLKHQFHHQKVRPPAAARPPARAHTLVGAFSSALEPGNPFSVLSFPEELMRHSFFFS